MYNQKTESNHFEQINNQVQSLTVTSTVKQRRRKTSLPSLDNHLMKIMRLISKGKYISFQSSTKTTRGLHNGESDRRSRFIGVLKGKSGWQTLINVGRTKRYIGTYNTEAQAALVHDFYCIGINGLKAKTNFEHNASQLQKMISDYYENGKKFNPVLYQE